MKIKSVNFSNFRCFEQYELRLAERLTLLIGDNASGKTAALDGLAVAAGAFLLGIQGANSRGIHKNDIRRLSLMVGQSVTEEIAGEVIIEAKGQVADRDLSWARTLSGIQGRTTTQFANDIRRLAEEMADKVRRAEPVDLPLMSYYGTGRLWRMVKAKGAGEKDRGRFSRFVGYKECLNQASDQRRLFRWFKINELGALQKRETRGVLEAVRRAITSMIPGARRVFWDADWDEMMIETMIGTTQQLIPFHFLSDGYRNILGMAADIAYRMAALNPQFVERAIAETAGIVLIDEIDLHLHPNWQKVVVRNLLETFPQVQFVATTHSPFIIQSLYDEKDVILWDLARAEPLPIVSKSIEDIAEDNQGVEIPQQSQRFLDMMDAAKN